MCNPRSVASERIFLRLESSDKTTRVRMAKNSEYLRRSGFAMIPNRVTAEQESENEALIPGVFCDEPFRRSYQRKRQCRHNDNETYLDQGTHIREMLIHGVTLRKIRCHSFHQFTETRVRHNLWNEKQKRKLDHPVSEVSAPAFSRSSSTATPYAALKYFSSSVSDIRTTSRGRRGVRI